MLISVLQFCYDKRDGKVIQKYNVCLFISGLYVRQDRWMLSLVESSLLPWTGNTQQNQTQNLSLWYVLFLLAFFFAQLPRQLAILSFCLAILNIAYLH